eukprot:6477793-Amphidinium_carterae.1
MTKQACSSLLVELVTVSITTTFKGKSRLSKFVRREGLCPNTSGGSLLVCQAYFDDALAPDAHARTAMLEFLVVPSGEQQTRIKAYYRGRSPSTLQLGVSIQANIKAVSAKATSI